MTIKKAYKVLKRHQAWRRDQQEKLSMQDAFVIGRALDTLLALAKKELLKKNARKGFIPQNPMTGTS